MIILFIIAIATMAYSDGFFTKYATDMFLECNTRFQAAAAESLSPHLLPELIQHIMLPYTDNAHEAQQYGKFLDIMASTLLGLATYYVAQDLY